VVCLYGAAGDRGAGPATAHQAAALTAASSAYVTLTASSLDAVGLAYAGIATVSGTSGDVQVLRFTMTSGAITDLNLTQPCTGGVAVVTTAATASLGSTTFDALSLTVTVGGNTATFTPTNPPTTPFPGEIVLQAITLSATTVSSATLSAPSVSVQSTGC
jgi:hypothetical protein